MAASITFSAENSCYFLYSIAFFIKLKGFFMAIKLSIYVQPGAKKTMFDGFLIVT